MIAQIENEMCMLNFKFKMEQSTPSRVLRAWTIAKDDGGSCIDYNDERFDKITHISHVECTGTPQFGDILDFSGYRHYHWLFVGKCGRLWRPSGNYHCHPFADNIEYGVVVPSEICRYLEDPWEKYKSNNCVQAYEVQYNSKIVQNYKNVPTDSLYTYMFDYDNYGWQLYAYQPGSEILVKK